MNGRLAQLLTEGSSPNPRWLVNLIGQNKHEEMYEKSFGKLISQAEDDAMLNNPATSSSSPPSSAQRRSTKPNGGGVTNKKGSNGKNSGTSSEGEAETTRKLRGLRGTPIRRRVFRLLMDRRVDLMLRPLQKRELR